MKRAVSSHVGPWVPRSVNIHQSTFATPSGAVDGVPMTRAAAGFHARTSVRRNPQLPVLKLFARLTLWNLLPNGRRAHFFTLWAGRRKLVRFRAELRRDLVQVFSLMGGGHLTAQIAGRFRLSEAAAALRFAEEGGHAGKVVIVADENAKPLP